MKSLGEKAASFIHLCYSEWGKSAQEAEERVRSIQAEIEAEETYTHTLEELNYGAQLAWRNANKCIGRLFWETLTVFDERETRTAAGAAQAAKRHLHYAANDGKIRPAITIFPPAVKGRAPFHFLNHQLIRYAGYETGKGDPHSIHLTKKAQQAGWQAPGGDFDILPLLIEDEQGEIHLFTLDHETDISEVQLRHPEKESFRDLGLKWYTVPVISDMELEIGGIVYPASPFNGWYMGTEIGARNLADEFRYDKLREVALLWNLDITKASSLWKDRALVELNRAVIHSFQEDGVSLVDHHTAAEQFRVFYQKEARQGREVTGDWSWLIPPMSPAATHVFHQQYRNVEKSPGFRHRESAASTAEKVEKCPFSGSHISS